MLTQGRNIEDVNHASSKFRQFLILLIIGFFIIFTGIITTIIAVLLSGGSVDFCALIFIGPFPIVVGAGPEATWMILFAIILAVLSIITFLILRRKTGKAKT